jgi:outer membrane protein assembly factor BamB
VGPARAWRSQTNGGGSGASPSLDATRAYSTDPCDAHYAVDRATGALAWSHGESCGGGGSTAPLYGGRLRGREDGAQLEDDARDGRLLDGIPATAPAAVRGNLAVVSDGTLLVGYEFPTWRPRWTFELPVASGSPPLVVGRDAYITDHDGYLYAVDVVSGRQVWTTAAGDGLLLVPGDGALYAFESAAP